MKNEEREHNKMFLREQLIDYLSNKKFIDCGTEEHPKKFTCINPKHDDSKPSMNIYRSNGTLKVHCFSCGSEYDIFDVVGLDIGTEDFNTQYNYLCEIYGLKDRYIKVDKPMDWDDAIGKDKTLPTPVKADAIQSETKQTDYTEYYKKCCSALINLRDERIRERITRGLELDTIMKFNLGYDAKYNNHNGDAVAIIPHTKQSYNARRINKPLIEKYGKYAKAKGIASDLFNADALKKNIVIVTEGEYDAMTLEQLGFNAIALGSVNNINLLLKAIDSLSDEEKQSKDFIFNFDNDDAGRKASIRITEELTKRKIKYFDFVFLKSGDANDYLINGKDEELKRIFNDAINNRLRAKEYLIDNNTLTKLEKFKKKIDDGIFEPPIPTGFENLDKCLDGGLFKGIYTIGAESSLGKTTFALQMLDQIAQNGTDVLIFSLEMPVESLLSKSISRLTYIKAPDKNTPLGESKQAKTLLGIKQGERYINYSSEELYLIDKAEQIYSKYANHIFIFEKTDNFTVEEVKNKVRNHILVTGHKPVVLIDYLQLLEPLNKNRTYQDKQLVEENIKYLVKLWKEYNIPIILISSMNRGSYAEQVSFSSLKESGIIEYSSDVVIGLQFDIFHSKEVMEMSNGQKKAEYIKRLAEYERTQFIRNIELKILKNRENKTGDIIKYEYIPMFNYFSEGEIVKNNIKPEVNQVKSKTKKSKKDKTKNENEDELIDLIESWDII